MIVILALSIASADLQCELVVVIERLLFCRCQWWFDPRQRSGILAGRGWHSSTVPRKTLLLNFYSILMRKAIFLR
jgi:hypothetical protein